MRTRPLRFLRASPRQPCAHSARPGRAASVGANDPVGLTRGTWRGAVAACAASRRSIGHDARRTASSTKSSASTTRRFAPKRRRGATASRAAIHRRGVSRVPPLRTAGGRLRPVSLRRLQPRAPAAVLVQGTCGVSELRRPADGGTRGAPRGPCVSACAGAAVGVESAAPPALCARLGSRAVPRGRRRVHARRPRRPASSCPFTGSWRWA